MSLPMSSRNFILPKAVSANFHHSEHHHLLQLNEHFKNALDVQQKQAMSDDTGNLRVILTTRGQISSKGLVIVLGYCLSVFT
jgi:hypothetical protein